MPSKKRQFLVRAKEAELTKKVVKGVFKKSYIKSKPCWWSVQYLCILIILVLIQVMAKYSVTLQDTFLTYLPVSHNNWLEATFQRRHCVWVSWYRYLSSVFIISLRCPAVVTVTNCRSTLNQSEQMAVNMSVINHESSLLSGYSEKPQHIVKFVEPESMQKLWHTHTSGKYIKNTELQFKYTERWTHAGHAITTLTVLYWIISAAAFSCIQNKVLHAGVKLYLEMFLFKCVVSFDLCCE